MDAAGAKDLRVLVLEAGQLRVVSVTVLDMLRELDAELAEAGVELRIAGMSDAVAEVARRGDWFARIEREGRVFPSVDAAAHA